MGEMKY